MRSVHNHLYHGRRWPLLLALLLFLPASRASADDYNSSVVGVDWAEYVDHFVFKYKIRIGDVPLRDLHLLIHDIRVDLHK